MKYRLKDRFFSYFYGNQRLLPFFEKNNELIDFHPDWFFLILFNLFRTLIRVHRMCVSGIIKYKNRHIFRYFCFTICEKKSKPLETI